MNWPECRRAYGQQASWLEGHPRELTWMLASLWPAGQLAGGPGCYQTSRRAAPPLARGSTRHREKGWTQEREKWDRVKERERNEWKWGRDSDQTRKDEGETVRMKGWEKWEREKVRQRERRKPRHLPRWAISKLHLHAKQSHPKIKIDFLFLPMLFLHKCFS